MKRLLLFSFMVAIALAGRTQQIDSIEFHLYTDSLKKGTYNYINIDGKLSNGRWMPLTQKDLILSSTACSFEGNDLVVPAGFSEPFLTITATLRSNPGKTVSRRVWVKQLPDPALPADPGPVRGNQPTKKRRS